MFLFSVSFVVKQNLKEIVCVEPFQNVMGRLLLVLIWYIDSIFRSFVTSSERRSSVHGVPHGILCQKSHARLIFTSF